MTRPGPWLHVLIVVLATVSCSETSLEEYPVPDGFVFKYRDSGATDAAADQGDAADAAAPEAWVGTACENDDDCEPGTCFTKEFLEGFGIEIDGLAVTNGMCSRLGCASNDQCGPQGVCFNTQPFSGTPISICLQLCADIAACRWQEGYSCFDPTTIDVDPFEGGPGACLPDSIVVAIVCDDGHCDEGAEQ